jgi:hypothetical protein
LGWLAKATSSTRSNAADRAIFDGFGILSFLVLLDIRHIPQCQDFLCSGLLNGKAKEFVALLRIDFKAVAEGPSARVFD